MEIRQNGERTVTEMSREERGEGGEKLKEKMYFN